MKAVKLKAEGNSSRLTFENVNIPSLNSNEILIRVYSVGLNTSEITRLSKIFSRNLDNFSSYVIGTDIAGIIVEMGSDVTLLKKGMHVFGSLPDMNIYDGALAQYVKVTENDIAQIPEEIDFSKAASVVSSGCAVCEAILNNLKLRSKEKILIHYAGTTLGYLAVQLASDRKSVV